MGIADIFSTCSRRLPWKTLAYLYFFLPRLSRLFTKVLDIYGNDSFPHLSVSGDPSCPYIMASYISSHASGRIASPEKDQIELRHARLWTRARQAAENIIHNRRQHPSGDALQYITPLRPREPTSEENDPYEVDSGSRDDLYEREDDAALLSQTELASIIAESGHGRDLPTTLCHTCQSIAGWFFLDRHTWQRATADSPWIEIQNMSQASLVSTCLLCSFLGKVTQRLRLFSLAKVEWRYLCAMRTNEVFSNTSIAQASHDAPLFTVKPSSTIYSWRNIGEFNVYFAPNSLHQGFDGVHARQIGPYADPALIRKWIAFCDAHHQRFICNGPRQDVPIPYFCVIDCNVSPPCLVYLDSRDSRGYITLSYVWGQDPCEGPDECGRLPHRLPELIQGAIWVTVTLGYQFLWIDRYCVPQNEQIRKHSLITNMDRLYEDSALCIIAAAARSPRDGLHGITRPRYVRQETIKLGSIELSQIMTNIKEEVGNSCWGSRGWTYQESILAKRRLLFTETQCCFQCGEQWFLETLNYPTQSTFDFSCIPHPFPELSGKYHDLHDFDLRAKEYSRRQLSKDSDAVPAITGILKRFRYFTHVSGVPVFHPAHSKAPLVKALLEGLGWSFAVNYSAVQSSAWNSLPRRRLGVPSWTWCAWECGSTPYEPSWNSLSSCSSRNDFLATTNVAVEDAQGNVKQFSGSSVDEMAQKLSVLSEVRILRVRGWVCDVALPDALQHHPPQNTSDRHSSIRYVDVGANFTRLSTLARQRHMPSVDGYFIFRGWIMSIVDRSGSGNFETWKVMLLSCADNGQDVERFDTCLIRFDTVPSLSPDTTRLGEHGWTLQSFRIL